MKRFHILFQVRYQSVKLESVQGMAPHDIFNSNPIFAAEFWGHYVDFIDRVLDMEVPQEIDDSTYDPYSDEAGDEEEEEAEEEEIQFQFDFEDYLNFRFRPFDFNRYIPTGWDDRTIPPSSPPPILGNGTEDDPYDLTMM